VLECVPNVAEGRHAELLDALSRVCGPSLLDRHVDTDHHRAVFTLAGPGADDAEDAARALARAAANAVDLADHAGAHPRLGVVDVVPFVSLEDDHERAAAAARSFASWAAAELAVPVFLYDDADPLRRSLPELRRDAFRGRRPDLGPDRPHPRLGATAVGARPPLVAVNCWLDTNDRLVASEIARSIRERDGGLPGVRALGILLDSLDVAQVSMNLVDLPVTGIEAACTEVRRIARVEGFEVTQVELVGLLPRAELERCGVAFREWVGLDDSVTIEGRIERAVAPAPVDGDRPAVPGGD
jgi:glutamate formiminotransferase